MLVLILLNYFQAIFFKPLTVQILKNILRKSLIAVKKNENAYQLTLIYSASLPIRKNQKDYI
jgi:hypothetical protein